jgi:GT2 family glycosyltransferase
MVGGAARVDVGIVSWNTRELTLKALRHLADLPDRVELRVLVRDNGSTDGTADAVAAELPEVVLDRGPNVGFAGGVNALLALSDAPWFLTLNSDAWPEPGALEQLLRVGEAHPQAAAVAPLLLRPEGGVEHSAHPLPSLATAAVPAVGAQRLLGPRAGDGLLPGTWQHDEERPVGWAVGAALLLRRAAVEQVGPFDDSLFMYGEDLDWCWRAHERGWQTWFTPAAVVRHVGNASGEQRWGESRDRVVIGSANRVVAQHLPAGRARVWRGLNAAGALRSAARARVRGDRDLAASWRRQVTAHLRRP